MFFQIPTVWGPWRVLDLPDRITYSHTHSNAKLFPHTIHCVKPPQKIKLWSLRPSYQVLYPCPKSLAATIDGGLTAKEAEQVSCLSSPPSIHITHTHTCRRTHSRPLQSVLSSYPDPQLPVLANRRRFKFHSVKKLAHCYSVTGRANDVRQWQRWTPLSLWCLVAIAGPLLRRHRNAGDWQRRWWQQRLRERLTASVKCPVCVCVQECVSLSRLVLIPDTCWATVNCMHDSGEPSCQPCAPFVHGVLREELSFATCPPQIPEWMEISAYYPPPFFFFLGALTRDTVRSWRNPHPPFSCASSYGPSSMWPPSVPGPAPRSTGSQKPPWSAGDRCMCTSPRFQPLRSPTRWSQMERCNGTKTSPSLLWLVTASLGKTAPLGLWVLLLVAGLPGLGVPLSAVGKLSAPWCIPSCDWMLGTQQ